MVKSGLPKPCDGCGSVPSLSHRFHGRYVCGPCAGIPVPQSLVGHVTPLRCPRRGAHSITLERGDRVWFELMRSELVVVTLWARGMGTDLRLTPEGVLRDDLFQYGYYENRRKYDSEEMPEAWATLCWSRGEYTEDNIVYAFVSEPAAYTCENILNYADSWEKKRQELLALSRAAPAPVAEPAPAVEPTPVAEPTPTVVEPALAAAEAQLARSRARIWHPAAAPVKRVGQPNRFAVLAID